MQIKTFFLCAGFTQVIRNPIQCANNGGFCHFWTCLLGYYQIGRCFPWSPCCRIRVSSGFHKADIAV
uniref:Beta-defensin-like domain-containing protein n=1 Tax=Pelusios castaneus TaxID=367368 RepID=A0A8C8RGB2_9SAUR